MMHGGSSKTLFRPNNLIHRVI